MGNGEWGGPAQEYGTTRKRNREEGRDTERDGVTRTEPGVTGNVVPPSTQSVFCQRHDSRGSLQGCAAGQGNRLTRERSSPLS